MCIALSKKKKKRQVELKLSYIAFFAWNLPQMLLLVLTEEKAYSVNYLAFFMNLETNHNQFQIAAKCQPF